MRLTADGTLTYYHKDSPQSEKCRINLKHSSIIAVRAFYSGRRSHNELDLTKTLPHHDDELRIYTQGGSFFFRNLSNLASSNPNIKEWEKMIRLFSRKVSATYLH